MDGICSAVLNKIYALGGPGRYFIISEEEFFEAFPEDAERDGGELERALKELRDGGFIDVKYSSGRMYCVALLKTPAPEPESAEKPAAAAPTAVAAAEQCGRTNIKIFGAAFIGGALGGVVTSLISLLFLLC